MMNHESKSKLEKIIGDYETKLAEAARIEAAKRAADAVFPERFVAEKAKTIRPALQEIADMLNAHGHDAQIREQEESSSTVSGFKSAAITLCVVPKPFVRKPSPAPAGATSGPAGVPAAVGGQQDNNGALIEITFSAKRAERKVTVSSTNTMMSHAGNIGKRGEYEIDAVTTDVVTSHCIQTLGEAFGPGR